MFDSSAAASVDTAQLRKARGAFFTPDAIARYITNWAVRTAEDMVLEPSAGDAAFLVQAVRRLRALAEGDLPAPRVDGVEIHPHSAGLAAARIKEAGGNPNLIISDFFLVEPEPRYSVVIGNPPYIRYQDFTGESRTRSRAAALKAGVALTALASSWAAFTIHSALFLKPGGRMGLVLPAELLSVNYAAAVRQFLFDRFRSVELVLFTQQVFPEAEADVVLLLADGFDEGPTDHATIYQAQDADSLSTLSGPLTWTPPDPAAKWTGLLVDPDAIEPLHTVKASGHFTSLEAWGDTTLGMVTGNNRYFALSPARVKELGLTRKDLIRLSPPGSSHLRGLELSRDAMTRLGQKGKATWLFRPSETPSPAALAYIATGHLAGVDQAYKCRVRKPWYRVPLLPPADLLLTCMNADTPRLTTNSAQAGHLNSVHGVYLKDSTRELGRELLPLASLNSVTLLNAEMVGRSYGGGILKLEPREADVWAMPSLELVQAHADALRTIKARVATLLQHGQLIAAFDRAHLVVGHQLSSDLAVLQASGTINSTPAPCLAQLQQARDLWKQRRKPRDVDHGHAQVIDTRYDADHVLTGASRRLVDVCADLDFEVTQPELRGTSMTAVHRRWIESHDNEARERVTVLNLRHSLSAALVALTSTGLAARQPVSVNRMLADQLPPSLSWLQHPQFAAALAA